MTAEVEELRRIITEELRGSGCGDFPGYTIVAKHIAERLASALRSSRSGEGWVLVPREPTPEMIRSGWPHGLGSDDFLAFWPDLLAASPKALKTGGE